MTRLLFTAPYAWDGGYYELSFEFGAISDIEFRSALLALWAFPALEGCYLKRDREPYEQDRVPLEELDFVSHFNIGGLARLPNGYSVACGSVTTRLLDDGICWLTFYLPLGSLSEAYEIGAYPFDVPRRSPDAWQKSVDDWMAQIGGFVFSRVPFQLGLIGMEGRWTTAKELSQTGVPDKREIGYLWPTDGELQYLPKST